MRAVPLIWLWAPMCRPITPRHGRAGVLTPGKITVPMDQRLTSAASTTTPLRYGSSGAKPCRPWWRYLRKNGDLSPLTQPFPPQTGVPNLGPILSFKPIDSLPLANRKRSRAVSFCRQSNSWGRLVQPELAHGPLPLTFVAGT